MNAFGRQTAPPQIEVVSVTSALRLRFEAFRHPKDFLRAASAGSPKSQSLAELPFGLAPVILDAASSFSILSAPAVSGA